MITKWRVLRVAAVVLVASALVAAVWVAATAARLTLPPPTGKHAVGRTRFSWVDPARQELLEPERQREVIAEVWFPAKPGIGEPCPYMPELAAISADLVSAGQLKPIEAAGLHWIKSHGRAEAEFADLDGACPVIIFSPGNSTNVEFYSAYGEELASRGFVVFGVNHPYDVNGVRLADGTIATYRERPPGSEEALHARMQQRVADVRFLADQLAELNEGHGPLAHHLDLSKIGVMGHSLGGMTAGEACTADDRFLAGINVDGLHAGNPFAASRDETPPPQPFAYIGKERTIGSHTAELIEASPRGMLVSVPNARHIDFSDAALFQPVLNPFNRNSQRVLTYATGQAAEFFEKWLR